MALRDIPLLRSNCVALGANRTSTSAGCKGPCPTCSLRHHASGPMRLGPTPEVRGSLEEVCDDLINLVFIPVLARSLSRWQFRMSCYS
jgi:hypothetical protein